MTGVEAYAEFRALAPGTVAVKVAAAVAYLTPAEARALAAAVLAAADEIDPPRRRVTVVKRNGQLRPRRFGASPPT